MIVLSLLLSILCTSPSSGESVLERLAKHDQFSQFTSLVRSTEGSHTTHLDNFVTVFAPSNDAMEEFNGVKDVNLILNHMVSTSISPSQLGERLTSLMRGHPPLWVRKIGSSLFINQARVKSSFSLMSSSGTKQYLYLIDSVLEPIVPLEENIDNFNDIRAGDLIEHINDFRTGNFSIKLFADRINALGVGNFPELSALGKFTFVFPVDSAFQNLQVGILDKEVIQAHMIPNQLLFTKPQRRRAESHPTLQYNSTRGSLSLRVMAKVFQKNREGITVPLVESQTVVGNKQHKRGLVEARIVKGNIPVQNGIIHLIDRPLVIMASSMADMLDLSKQNNLRFSEFSTRILKYPELIQKMNQTTKGTLFIPTNEAFKKIQDNVWDRMSPEDAKRILSLHFLDHQTILTRDLHINQHKNQSKMFGVTVGSHRHDKVWFWNENENIYIDRGGAKAKLVDDVLASNGIVHTIDKVLGIPHETIFEKLANDPMMRKTFELGQQEDFNTWFKTEDIQFTYLVPTDEAWAQVKREYPTAYKVLFLGPYFYQVHHLLERHLQVGVKLSLDQLMQDSQEGQGFQVLRGAPLNLERTVQNEEQVTLVSNDGIVARVVRGNIECTNGYIHLIDRVVFKRRDVSLGVGSVSLPALISLVIPCSVLLLSRLPYL